MKRVAFYIALFSILGCEEPYEFDTDYKNAVVVDGRVSTAGSYVILNYSGGYSDQGQPLGPINNARVYIEDFSGFTADFTNPDNGNIYAPDSGFHAEIGQTYILTIEIGELKILSRPEKLTESVPFELATQPSERAGSSNSNSSITIFGNDVTAYFYEELPEETYYRWKYAGDWEHPYTYVDYHESPGSIFNVMEGDQINQSGQLSFDVIFLPDRNGTYTQTVNFVLSPDNLESDDYVGALTEDNVQEILDSLTIINDTYPVKKYTYTLTMIQKTMSKRGYEYWRSIQNQIEATGSIFDPVPANIGGNLFIPNSNEIVLGYFSAEDQQTREYEFVYLIDRIDNE